MNYYLARKLLEDLTGWTPGDWVIVIAELNLFQIRFPGPDKAFLDVPHSEKIANSLLIQQAPTLYRALEACLDREDDFRKKYKASEASRDALQTSFGEQKADLEKARKNLKDTKAREEHLRTQLERIRTEATTIGRAQEMARMALDGRAA